MPIQVTGIAEAQARHRAAADRARDPSEMLLQFRAELEAMIARAWASEVSPGGDAWPPRQRASESTGALRLATSVTVTEGAIDITVGAQHASWQFFGTRELRARNPLPVEPGAGGLVWMQRGEAGAWLDDMVRRLERYLAAEDLA